MTALFLREFAQFAVTPNPVDRGFVIKKIAAENELRRLEASIAQAEPTATTCCHRDSAKVGAARNIFTLTAGTGLRRWE